MKTTLAQKVKELILHTSNMVEFGRKDVLLLFNVVGGQTNDIIISNVWNGYELKCLDGSTCYVYFDNRVDISCIAATDKCDGVDIHDFTLMDEQCDRNLLSPYI